MAIMAEIISSAVAGEAVNRIASSLIGDNEAKSDGRDNMERLEMAHIKMEATLELSNRWQITDVPMLRWRSKLKRAARECDDTLRRCKQRAHEDEEIRQGVSQSSFPKRIAHAAKSFISSVIASSSDESSSSSSANVQRFERFADGANEFLKLVEFGGKPRQYMFFNPMIGQLLTGKALSYHAFQGSKFYSLEVLPRSSADRGVEAMAWFFFQDFKAPTKGFSLGIIMRLSESTDIFGVIIKCMQSVTPHFKFAAEGVRRELIQLPTQDFSWSPLSPYGESEYWIDAHNTLTQWYRPNPLCCNEHEHHLISSSSTCSKDATASSPTLSSVFPEQVMGVLLKCHISLSDQHRNHQNSSAEPGRGITRSLNPDIRPLKLGALFIPHDSPEDIGPSAESYALEVIDEKEQEMIHTNACLQDLDEKLLPKAIDHLYNNTESRMYKMCLKSRHGTAHFCVEKTSSEEQSARICESKSTRSAPRNRRVVQQQNIRMELWKQLSRDLVKVWVVRASDKLQGSIRSWTARN